MSEDNPRWRQQTFNGPNEKLIELAEKLAEAAKLGINEKLTKLKTHVNAEAKKMNNPVADKFAEEINKIEISL
jgi:hypothetical protein